MNGSEISEIIEILPRNNSYNAQELTKYRNIDIEPVRAGQKLAHPIDTGKDQNELIRLHAELKRSISMPRIDRLEGRALAEWDVEKGSVYVKRKDGKFDNFGYSHEGKLYLEYYEALFLLELGRMQLEYYNKVMSLEQAYLLLLGENASPKFNSHLVYSNFMRAGYILVKHKSSTLEFEENEYIWAILFEALRTPSTSGSNIIQSPAYHMIKESMENIKARIQGSQQLIQSSEQPMQSISNDTSVPNFRRKMRASKKRKSSIELWEEMRKRPCLEALSYTEKCKRNSFLNFLQNEAEYIRFVNIFRNFDIITLKAETSKFERNCRKLQIDFDVFLHKDGFKKSSPTAPSFRLAILNNDDKFPSNTDLVQCYNQEKIKLPILIVSISESKQIHAFLYFFT